MSELRVELFLDEEAGNWHYRVPALHINGRLRLPPCSSSGPPTATPFKSRKLPDVLSRHGLLEELTDL
jgi:hypothetical protein